MTFYKNFLCLFATLLLWQFSFSQIKKNTNNLDTLHTLVTKANNKKDKVNALLALCNYYKRFNTKQLDSLSHFANLAFNLSYRDSNLEEQKVESLYYLSLHAIEIGDYVKAKNYINQITSISERLSYAIGFVYSAELSGRISYLENNLNLAYLHFEKAYQTAKDYKLPKHTIFTTTQELLKIYLNNRYNKEIISIVLFENVDLAEDASIPVEDKALFYFYLGFYYDIYDIDIDKAIENYNKSIALYTTINDQHGLVYPLINLAEAYQIQGNYKKTIETFNITLELDLVKRKNYYYSFIYYGLGASYFELKNYETSEYNFRKAINENRIINDYIGEGDCLKAIGEIYLKQGATNKAHTILKRAIVAFKKGVIQLRKKNPLDKQIAYAYQETSEIYEHIGNYKKSLAYHSIYTTFNDSINNAQNTKVTERFQFLKEATEKNKEIEALENQNKIQQLKVEKEKTFKIGLLLFLGLIVLLLFIIINRYHLKQKALKIIQQKNEENKLLVREIHHRVKNNLQIISSLLGVQISNSENDKLKLILQESQNKIKSMSLIHQNLYKSDQFAKVSVQSYINELIEEIKSSYVKEGVTINFDLDITEKEIAIGLAVPLGLILNELITNSYKYAFSDTDNQKKNITIGFNQLENKTRYRLIVKDNGKGLPADFNVDKLSSFGLQLVYGLTAQLHGDVNITQNKGTTFNIVLEEPTGT